MRTLRRTLATAIPLCIALALLSSATACAGGGWFLAGDTDGDKLSDYEEVMGRTVRIEINNLPGADITYTVNSDPTKVNSDNDLLDDYWEKQYGTDPRHEDTDNDGLMDQDELIDDFGGGWMSPGDTDTDGTPNGPTDWDSNGNAVPDGLENVVSGFPSFGQLGYDGGADYDGDGLSNDFERTTDYDPNLAGVQCTSYLTKDSDKDGFLDGADLDSGAPKVWKVLTKSSTGIFTKIDYLVKIGLDMGIQRGEGYLAPASAVGSGQKWTKPLNGDCDTDGIPDGNDADPTVDIKVTVKILEILELDKVDDQLIGHNPADFYVWVKCDSAKPKMFGVEMPWYQTVSNKKSEPLKVDDDNLTPDELTTATFTFNVPDYKDELRTFTIYLFDDDGGDESTIQESLDGGDDICDINRIDEGGDENNPTTSFLEIHYNLKSAQWTYDDDPLDPNGYGHASGNEDWSTGTSGIYDQDDCEIWFDITQNDNDGDGIPYCFEMNYCMNPTIDESMYDKDGDGISNWYEWKYCLNIDNPNDADEDYDNDGLESLWEYQMNQRNPRDDSNVFRISLAVSVGWDATTGELDEIKAAFQGASLYMMTVTDGYVYISEVNIYNNKQNWNDVNVRIGDTDAITIDNHYWPRAEINGYWNGNDWWGFPTTNRQEVTLPRLFSGHSPDNTGYVYVIVHELGHYIFGFYDEYELDGYEQLGVLSLMNGGNYYLSYDGLYESQGNPNTKHIAVREMPCWEWFVYQMGECKGIILFDYISYDDTYEPYAMNGFININFDFSKLLFIGTYYDASGGFVANPSTVAEVISYVSPNMDIRDTMNIQVIE